MPLGDPAADLAEDRLDTAAARAAANERDDAEGAGEGAAVLDAHEGPRALEAPIRLDAADRADVTGDEGGRLLGAAADDDHVRGQSRERVAGEVGAAARDVDPPVRARGPRDRPARLPHRLVRDAAGVDDGDVAAGRLGVAVAEQRLADPHRVRVRDLAAEEASREGRHGGRDASASARTGPPPTRRAGGARRARRPAAPPARTRGSRRPRPAASAAGATARPRR